MRMVIELRRGTMPEVVLNHLFLHTQMQTVFGINLVALVDGQPRLLNLKQIIESFIRHRREVVTRRTLFDLRKARDRAHVLEGYAVALANIDPVIERIRASSTRAEARDALMAEAWLPGVVDGMLARAGADTTRPAGLEPGRGLVDGRYHLTEQQAQAILDLQLHRLTGLEQEKIVREYDEIIGRIQDLMDILENPDRMRQVIRDELTDLRAQFGDARRTEIVVTQQDFNPEDLIPPEDVIVTLSHTGYVKWQSIDEYAVQRRGGKGKMAASTKDEDFVERLFVANTHDWVLCFSSRGKVYWLRVFQLPRAGRTSRGTPIVNLLAIESEERINTILALSGFDSPGYVLMVTARGTVKKTPLVDFSRPRTAGIIAVDLAEDDQLVDALLTSGRDEIMLASSGGRMVRFEETTVRPMGRTARGVIGMRMDGAERIVGLMTAEPGLVLTATENGYGKCTPVDQYPVKGRGGKGVISIQTSERNGPVVAARLVKGADEIMLITDGGKLVRTPVAGISVLGRNTQGVRLIRLAEGERLVSVERVADDQLTAAAASDAPVSPDEVSSAPPPSGADDDAGDSDAAEDC
ncbi:MAG: DNA gyrase subunit A, partial [Chromatiales bacterium]|nr:DNA gyrase subunit A [Chromatiales bacterium]